MKMKRKLVAIVLCLVMVVSLIPTFALADEGKRGANGLCISDKGPEGLVNSKLIEAQVKKALAEWGIDPSIAPELIFHKYSMEPGDYISGESTLSNTVPYDFDIFVFILDGDGTWEMEIQGASVGDIMAAAGLVARQPLFEQAISPLIISLGPIDVEEFAIGVVIVGYLTCFGGFPTSYSFDASFNGSA